MRDYVQEVAKLLPGETEFDQLIRKEVFTFVKFFNETLHILTSYDRDLPKMYRQRDDILLGFKMLQDDYINIAQKMALYRQQIGNIKARLDKMENETPLWENLGRRPE